MDQPNTVTIVTPEHRETVNLLELVRCPVCDSPAGRADHALAPGQHYCPDPTCPVVSYLDRQAMNDLRIDRLKRERGIDGDAEGDE